MISDAPAFFRLFDHLGHQCLVPGCLRGDADHVNVVFDRFLYRLFGRLEQRPDVDVEAEVGEGRGDHPRAAVVPVLAQLADQHARPAPLVPGEVFNFLLHVGKPLVVFVGGAVNA